MIESVDGIETMRLFGRQESLMKQVLDRFKPGFVWGLILALGIILRFREYFLNRSFWSDEASLAFNLATRTFGGLTQRLDYEQGAPIGFLFIEKLSIIGLGNNEYAMRLLPLLSGLAAIYLIYRIARTHFGASGLFALLICCLSPQLVYYSSELKQYSSDVMIGLLLICQADRCMRENVRARDILLLGISGMFAVWLSYPALFVLAGIGLALILHKLSQKDYVPFTWIFALGIAWVASFVVEYYLYLQYLASDEFLQRYWAKAFMPLPPWSNLGWFIKTYFSLLYMSLSTLLTTFYILPVLIFIGVLSLFVRNRNLARMVIIPFVAALIASALQKYPLKDRFMLFLVPLVLLLVSEGLGRIYSFLVKWNRSLALASCGIIAVLLGWLPIRDTFDRFISASRNSGVRPVIQYVAENRLPGDIIYVYHGSDPAFHYYAPLYGLNPSEAIIGYDTTNKRKALEGFFDDVDTLNGKDRVWFIFSDVFDCGGCEGDMQAFYVAYLDERGTMIDSFHGVGANAYLYNLNR